MRLRVSFFAVLSFIVACGGKIAPSEPPAAIPPVEAPSDHAAPEHAPAFPTVPPPPPSVSVATPAVTDARDWPAPSPSCEGIASGVHLALDGEIAEHAEAGCRPSPSNVVARDYTYVVDVDGQKRFVRTLSLVFGGVSSEIEPEHGRCWRSRWNEWVLFSRDSLEAVPEPVQPGTYPNQLVVFPGTTTVCCEDGAAWGDSGGAAEGGMTVVITSRTDAELAGRLESAFDGALDVITFRARFEVRP